MRDIVWLSDSTVVLALEGQGLVRSADGGASWTFPTLPSDLESVGRIQIAAESWNGSTSRDTLYAVAGHDLQQNFLGFWRSADAGVSWEGPPRPRPQPPWRGRGRHRQIGSGLCICVWGEPQQCRARARWGINLLGTMDGGQTGRDFMARCVVGPRTHADQHDLLWLDNGDVVVSNDGGC